MRSSTRWIVEVIAVSVALLLLGPLVSHAVTTVGFGGSPSKLAQLLVTIYLVLVGLVVELVRWGRDSIEQASGSLEQVLDKRLSESAERAVRGSVLRSIFPSGSPDPITTEIQFNIVENYLRRVETWAPLVQRASGVLAQRHLSAWGKETDDLTGSAGVRLKMDESARMSEAMVLGGTSYLAIERAPCEPPEAWSPGFLKSIERMGTSSKLRKKFILLADATTLWGDSSSGHQQRERDLYLLEEAYLRRHGFEVCFCDERVVHRELGSTELPKGNFEIFSEQVALQMAGAERYDKELTVWLHPLSEMESLSRFLAIVEDHATKMTSRTIGRGPRV